MSVVIETQGLKKSFLGKHILKGIDLKVHQGDTVVVLGESGTGKSVLLKHLIGLMEPDEGKIFFKGKEVQNYTETQWMDIRKDMSFVFQGAALFDSMSVFDNVAFPMRERNMGEKEIKEAVEDRLHHVGLPHAIYQYPSSLSGGMRKRVSVARALVLRPEVLLYDEPTTGLDPVMTAQISDLITQMADDYGVTSIVVSHDIKSALSIADHLVVLYEGKVYAMGTTDEIAHSDDPLIRQCLEGRSEGPIDPLRARS